MKQVFYLLISIVLLLVGCRSSKLHTVETDSREYNVKAQHSSFLTRPLVADLVVDEERKKINYSGPLNLPINDLKDNAAAKFLEEYQCDFVADPVYEVSKKVKNGFTKEIKIQLSGFPIKYKKIYQVDTLPYSITQYSDIQKDVRRIDYYESVEKESIVWGVEARAGEYLGAQIDFPLGATTRYYLSFEKVNANWSFQADIFEDRASDPYTGSGNGNDYFSISTGLFKESEVADLVKLRYGAGVNFTSYNLTSDFVASNQIKFSNIYNVGFRILAGLDIPLYRNFSIIGQVHYNFDGANIVYTEDPGISPNADLSVEDIDISKSPEPPIYLGAGLRVVF